MASGTLVHLIRERRCWKSVGEAVGWFITTGTVCGGGRVPGYGAEPTKDPKRATCLSCLLRRGHMAEYRRRRKSREFKSTPVTPR